MAAELTTQGIRTPCGGQWSACAVRNVLQRLEAHRDADTSAAATQSFYRLVDAGLVYEPG